MNYGKIVLGVMIVLAIGCTGERSEGEQKRSLPGMQFSLGDKSFNSNNIKAFTSEGEEENTKKMVIVSENEDGGLAELYIKNIDKNHLSFSVEKGAEVSFRYKDDQILCTTALTMNNDSSLNIDQHDPVTNFISGSFSGFDCAGTMDNSIGAGRFAVNYEEVSLQNSLLLDLDDSPLVPGMVYVNVTPEPMNTIQITGFNGGTESYTLILKKDLPAGNYEMHEFDVAPYFFFSDAEHNQYETTSGEVTLEPFDEFTRILRGTFTADLTSDVGDVKCEGSFEIFVF